MIVSYMLGCLRMDGGDGTDERDEKIWVEAGDGF